MLFWGRLADRWGNRLVFLLSILTIALSLGVLALAPGYAPHRAPAFILVALGFGLRGAGMAGEGIAFTVRLMHSAPAKHRGSYMTVFMTMRGAALACSSLLAGTLLTLLPATIRISGLELFTERIFFPGVLLIMLAALFGLRRLPRIAEPGMGRIMASFTEYLPPFLASPFQAPLRFLRRAKPGKSPKNR